MEENNRVIAEFEGWKSGLYPNMPNTLHKDKRSIHVSELQYHSDWNELMRVIKKLHDIAYSKENFHKMAGAFMNVGHAILSYDINKVYSAVLEFINWYNTQPQ